MTKKLCDEDMYKYLRKKAVSGKNANLQLAEKCNLESSMDSKIKTLKMFGVIPSGLILDIGTEDLEYLKFLREEYKQDAYGINIQNNDFRHYDEKYKSFNRNVFFRFYDGINIPFDADTFGLITMMSVMHHVPPDNLEMLVRNVERVLKPGGYFFIKENDLTEEKFVDAFNIQHEIFEGSVFPGHPAYRNSAFTIRTFLNMTT